MGAALEKHNFCHLASLLRNTQNTAVNWLTLVLRIWEVPGSNLSPETGYAD
jgi:hypothetical protein